jgi:hypothetical protein
MVSANRPVSVSDLPFCLRGCVQHARVGFSVAGYPFHLHGGWVYPAVAPSSPCRLFCDFVFHVHPLCFLSPVDYHYIRMSRGVNSYLASISNYLHLFLSW